jgi:hypothetical protein
MNTPRKIVLQSLHGYRTELDRLVKDWIDEGVKYVGIVGVDAAQIEDIIDDLCVGDGSAPYFMLTASHSSEETLEDAVIFAETLSDEYSGKATVIQL